MDKCRKIINLILKEDYRIIDKNEKYEFSHDEIYLFYRYLNSLNNFFESSDFTNSAEVSDNRKKTKQLLKIISKKF
jgi:hypothetical protein